MKILKKAHILILSAMAVLLLTGCPDLGDYENDDDYVNSFEISWIDGNNKYVDDYDMRDFYYPGLSSEINSPMEKPTKMKYLYIKAARDMNIENMAFYIKTPTGGELTIKAFIMDDMPDKSKFRDLNDELTKIKNHEEIDLSTISDPMEDSVASAKYSLGKSRWDSRLFNIYQPIKSGQYIVFQFVENVDAYYKPADGSEESMVELIQRRNKLRVDLYIAAVFIRMVNPS